MFSTLFFILRLCYNFNFLSMLSLSVWWDIFRYFNEQALVQALVKFLFPLQRRQQTKTKHGYRACGKSPGCATWRTKHRNGPRGEEDALGRFDWRAHERLFYCYYVTQVRFPRRVSLKCRCRCCFAISCSVSAECFCFNEFKSTLLA